MSHSHRSRLVALVRRTLRLSTSLVIVSVGLGVLSGRILHARVKEAVLSVGHELAGLADITRGSEVVLLNGERFHHSFVLTSEPVQRVLDRVQGLCEADPGQFARATTDFENLHGARRATHASLRGGTIRDETADRGMVVCFAGGPVGGLEGFATVLKQFVVTRDLSGFGLLRYAFAERKPDSSTRVVTLWADTGLNLAKLIPTTGDAAGTDSVVLPRPPEARRVLSVTTDDARTGLRLYRSEQEPDVLAQHYLEWMREQGWEIAATAEAEGTTAYLRHDGYQAIVTALREKSGAYLALIESGSALAGSDTNVTIATREGTE